MPPHRPLGNNNDSNWASFQIFFQGWLIRQQHYLDQLLSSHDNKPQEELYALISQVLSHYQQYYEAKSILIRQDVYIVFSPPWFSSYERTFLWIAGFKPGLVFKLLNNAVPDLSEEQLENVRRLMMETRAAERELNDEMARVQESVVGPQVADMAGITTTPVTRAWKKKGNKKKKRERISRESVVDLCFFF
ncbi:Transcription factor TGA like domain [Macleaya cordata]|uniref:Transcription factor TGA like domain n=1 Tax=Macleaya cordata TaxID=56857 RepID=A0A200PWY4_MACCD|nr:Transcription factor TGA like domain [Macleaya cordata]